MRGLLATYLAVLVQFGATSAHAVDNNLYLIALAGQSNMVGAGDVSALPTGFPVNGSRIWNFNNAWQWVPAKESIDDSTGQIDKVSLDGGPGDIYKPGVGPGLIAADTFAKIWPSAKIGLIPCAKGGSKIVDWLPGKSRTTLYGSCMARQKEAAKQGTVRAVLFWQGGSDTAKKTNAERWGSKFTKMVRRWRKDVGDPTLPFIIVLTNPENTASEPYRTIVRNQQISVALPHVTKIDISDKPIEYYPGGIHLTTKGQLIVGSLIASTLPQP